MNYFNLVNIFILMAFPQCYFKRKLDLATLRNEKGARGVCFLKCIFRVFGSKSKSKQPYSVYFAQILFVIFV